MKNVNPYTLQEYESLPDEQQQAIGAIAEYLGGNTVAIEDYPDTLKIYTPGQTPTPAEEVDTDSVLFMRLKFLGIYEVSLELAEQELRNKGYQDPEQFSFGLVMEPCYEDPTHIVILDYHKPILYLHESHNPWSFHFETLAHVAAEVLRLKNLLVRQIIDGSKPKER